MLISGYIDGEITQSERERLTSHLKDCRRCQHELFSLRKMVTLTRSLGEVSPPTHLGEEILERIIERPKIRRVPRWFAIQGFAAAALLLLALYAWRTLPHLFITKEAKDVLPIPEETFVVKDSLKIEKPSLLSTPEGVRGRLASIKAFSIEEEAKEPLAIPFEEAKLSLLAEKEIEIHVPDVDKKAKEIEVLLVELGGKMKPSIFDTPPILDERNIQAEVPRSKLHDFISRVHYEKIDDIGISKEMDPYGFIPSNYAKSQRLNIRLIRTRD
jgi:hypothetical protein